MKLFTPQVHLIRRLHFDEPDSFVLHAVTFCDRTNFRADGVEPLPDTLDEQGRWHIGLRIVQDGSLPDCYSLTPVVHTLVLENPPFGDVEGTICVDLYIGKAAKAQARSVDNQESSTTPESKPAPKPKPQTTTTVSTPDAKESSRPFEDF